MTDPPSTAIRRRRVLLGTSLAVILAIAAFVVSQRLPFGKPDCADAVGLSGPVAATPREALEAHLHQVEGKLNITVDHSSWSQQHYGDPIGQPGSVLFTSPVPTPDTFGRPLVGVIVGPENGAWTATGGCLT